MHACYLCDTYNLLSSTPCYDIHLKANASTVTWLTEYASSLSSLTPCVSSPHPTAIATRELISLITSALTATLTKKALHCPEKLDSLCVAVRSLCSNSAVSAASRTDVTVLIEALTRCHTLLLNVDMTASSTTALISPICDLCALCGSDQEPVQPGANQRLEAGLQRWVKSLLTDLTKQCALIKAADGVWPHDGSVFVHLTAVFTVFASSPASSSSSLHRAAFPAAPSVLQQASIMLNLFSAEYFNAVEGSKALKVDLETFCGVLMRIIEATHTLINRGSILTQEQSKVVEGELSQAAGVLWILHGKLPASAASCLLSPLSTWLLLSDRSTQPDAPTSSSFTTKTLRLYAKLICTHCSLLESNQGPHSNGLSALLRSPLSGPLLCHLLMRARESGTGSEFVRVVRIMTSDNDHCVSKESALELLSLALRLDAASGDDSPSLVDSLAQDLGHAFATGEESNLTVKTELSVDSALRACLCKFWLLRLPGHSPTLDPLPSALEALRCVADQSPSLPAGDCGCLYFALALLLPELRRAWDTLHECVQLEQQVIHSLSTVIYRFNLCSYVGCFHRVYGASV